MREIWASPWGEGHSSLDVYSRALVRAARGTALEAVFPEKTYKH